MLGFDVEKLLEEMREVAPQKMAKAEASFASLEEITNQLIVESVIQTREHKDNADSELEFALSMVIYSIASHTLEMKAEAIFVTRLAETLEDETIDEMIKAKESAEEMNTVQGLTVIALITEMLRDLTGGDATKRMVVEACIENMLYNAKK